MNRQLAGASETTRRTLGAALRALAGRGEVDLAFVADAAGGSITGRQVRLAVPRRAGGAIDLPRLRGAADDAALLLRCGGERWPPPETLRGERATRSWRALAEARAEALAAGLYPGVADNIGAALDGWAAERETTRSPVEVRAGTDLPLALRLYLRERLLGRRAGVAAERLVAGWRARFARHQARFERLAQALAAATMYRDEAAALLHELGLADDSSKASDTAALAVGRALPPATRPPAAAGSMHAPLSSPLAGTVDAAPPGRSSAMADVGALDDARAGDAYRVFTTRYDEIVEAAGIAAPSDLIRLRARLDEETARLHSSADRLARRLQRRLQVWQQRDWEFDREEGILDCSRLARLATESGQPLSFKVEGQERFVDTVVTLLIDNSGSMRGRSIVVAAQVAELLARAFERCHVKLEILGYTTRDWRDGPCHARWVAAGSPRRPGRLNALRHIVYKSADTPWRRARNALGAMLADDLLKENIDGEALLWAYARLRSRREARKILMVVSDGAPIDEATAAANGGGYLERHLRSAIAQIERGARVELTAIGIGHDVGRHYPRALRIFDADELGGAVMEEFSALLSPGRRRSRRGR